jgi:two-component system, chemotaxis family, CheB/CheR fusion protein
MPDDSPLSPDSSKSSPSSSNAKPNSVANFFVVGIGASAGGLDAITELLKRLPARSNLAVVFVQHLDPHHESMLVELLARASNMPVHWVSNGAAIAPSQVYVGPPNSCLSIEHGVLMLREPEDSKPAGYIDHFFRSLAEDRKYRAVGVILSGNGTDGSAGAKAIKEAGGIVLAQDPATASFASMPRSAIDAGCVDRVLAPGAIGDELTKLMHHARLLLTDLEAEDVSPAGTDVEQLPAIFRLLASRTGIDFSEYKDTTIKRRLVRQMVLAKTAELGDYLKLLLRSPDEVEKLFDSLLINVTAFFRDPEYFDFLQESILPEILRHRADNMPIRIWVPGCSTGEEVYSLAILVRETLEKENRELPVQIFGTDISERVVSNARGGVFSAPDMAGISAERLRRFFSRNERGYVIEKRIRDMCIFARQNVAKDSPFSRLDLVSCRNLLIYLSPKLQRKLMSIFHYALNPDGYLILGSSESVGPHVDLYRLVDRRYRIYARKSTGHRASVDFPVDQDLRTLTPMKPFHAMPEHLKEPFDIIREADRIVLHRYGPIGVLVNDELEILQFRGDVSPYLAPTSGRASLSLLRMAREGLSDELQSAVNEARETQARVNRLKVPVVLGESARNVDIDVTPVSGFDRKERFYLILFTASEPPSAASKSDSRAKEKRPPQSQVDQLRQDLQATRNYLQSTIEKHEATNQELRAANEEIQSSNEELQSTNEELETAKEELQSTNEELTTVNEELHSRQLELIQLNNDLNNLINSVHLPIIILGQDMRIRRFTPMAGKVFNVIPTDIGRPLSDINIHLNVEELPRLMAEVVETLTLKELDVQDGDGAWYSMHLRPYKTAENKIDGVVLTLIDIDQMKRTIGALEEARDFAQAVIESAPGPMAVLTQDLRVQTANDAFARLFRSTRARLQDRPFFDAEGDHEGMKALRELLEGIVPTKGSLTGHPIRLDLPGIGPTLLVASARQIVSDKRSYPLVLLALQPAD